MPIASGAAGRVDVGEDVRMTWTPDGLQRKPKPAYKNHDSYLQRYNALKQSTKDKSNVLQVKQDSMEESNQETNGATEESPGESDGHVLGKPLSEDGSKNSRLCVLL